MVTAPSDTATVLSAARELDGELRALRRAVRAFPELGFEETETRRKVRDLLEGRLPHANYREVAGSGLLVTLPGEGPTVVLRACLDALPIEDELEAEYRSKMSGRCHACGHDGQVAVLAGALLLIRRLELRGTIHGLFQPAEETDLGARRVLDDGVLDAVEPDLVLGWHGHPDLAAGTISAAAGPVMGGITSVRCTVRGQEGHAASPHLAGDTITAAAQLVLDWQVALARRLDPRAAVVLSIGRIAGGASDNVLPGQVELEGTLRALDPAVEPLATAVMAEVAGAVELRTGTKVELACELVVPAVVNEEGAAAVTARAACRLLGRDAVVAAEATLGGDDFAWYLRRWPGCYAFLGERVEGRAPYGWHDAAYDLDETSLATGAALLAQVVADMGGGLS